MPLDSYVYPCVQSNFYCKLKGIKEKSTTLSLTCIILIEILGPSVVLYKEATLVGPKYDN